ncbi:DNA ligase 4-like [Amphiura filiformis]|uniref:DNA ligase 4-like n=1 Tax=Amphiura filiformis TaxID=82378 RepID=UPI003B20DBCD
MAAVDQPGTASSSSSKLQNVAANVPFGELAGFLEKVSKKHGNDNKKQIFKDFLDKWRSAFKSLHGNDKQTDDSFYPIMRLLLPQLERERVAYGIKENTLAKLYIDILGLAKNSADAQKLLNYRAPTAKQEAGDFASVAFFVLRNRCPEKGSLTIHDVNESLDAVASNNAAKKRDVVKKNLLHLLKTTSALEQKWLIRIIMKDIKVGLSQASIFHVFHPDAEDYFNVTNSMAKLCSVLRDPETRMDDVAMTVFSPFSPMLGMKAKPHQVEKIMNHKGFYIETKLDGERMQLHKKGDSFKYFSRRSHDYSHAFGKDDMEGSLTPHIANCFKSDVKECILDGEMCGYSTTTKAFLSKGEAFDIKFIKEDEEDLQVCYCVFDILLYNDKKLASCPLKERLQYLKRSFTPNEGRLFMVDRQQCSTQEEVVKALNDAIENREEGIIVKDPDSTYRPDKRMGSGWLKIKPEYMSNLMDELDLIVVGGYFGKGHRSHMVSHFLCAVAVPPSKTGDHPKLFHTFCRVGSGYTKQELLKWNMTLGKHWKNSQTHPPNHLLCTKESPEVWVEPRHSFIVQVKAAEIVTSNNYKTGCTLRFPRVEKIRDDKAWHQCMTTVDLENLLQVSEGKLATKFAGMDEDAPLTKKRKTVARVERPVAVASQYRAADVSDVKQVSKIFEDKEFCVVNGPSSHPKTLLEKRIAECGGQVVQNPGSDTFCVLADKVNLRAKNIISSEVYDVVRVCWLLECLDAKQCLPWLPSHMIHTSPDSAAAFALQYDRHGDSYTADVTVEKLKQVLNSVQQEEIKDSGRLSSEAIAEFENEYYPDESPLGLFRLCNVYLDSCLVIGDQSTHIQDSSLDLVALEMRFYGATINEELGEDTTHVVCDQSDVSRLQQYRALDRTRPFKRHIVTKEWVSECIESERLLTERHYQPVPED